MHVDRSNTRFCRCNSAPRQFLCDAVDRRELICGGGAALVAGLLAGLLGGASPASAEKLTGEVPELDRVTVRVLIDSYQFAVAPGRKIDGLDIQHFGWGIGDHPPARTLISEFGLSMHVETQRGSETRNTLIDFGFTPEALNNNIELVGLNPGVLDALVLSHGHYDHFGGLVGFLQRTSGRLKPKLPLYVGGEDCFCAREWTGPPVQGDFGVLDRRALEKADLVVTDSVGPSLVGEHGFTSGRISQSSFEKLLSPSAMTIGIENGLGCFPERLAEEDRKPGLVPDQFRHELATAFNLKGRGLIVLTSCSHRGLINTIKQAQAVSGVDKVHAVIGGFHLAPYQPDYLRQTIAALREIDPTYVVPLHCSGEPFTDLAKAELPMKLLRAYTGTRLVFDSRSS
ncbi:MBL fold metallo-hydrolase [Phyllobacterium brassicacearum]|uniref:MBL fold metallo-hydrolase n=1 Tax=Phyllobacterium brassicacearum TaxID=314235 RepID=A0A2P7B6I3_9HYPH|nr:MBL fold metallo-hydrolase [Phyllobacterium brassicacearum]TDQ16691.1 7,8-dihydropterin-6-yl-methyl-4-(beta-D-ribofuranosyl)aminobenzene 5'-phosphate synthase [Phyllobacterium brassicacearum]